jgi:aromatic ring-cleaving dioxygenase
VCSLQLSRKQAANMTKLQSPADIVSYHAHIYYDVAATRGVAEFLRKQIAELFPVQLGRWHDALVGPHTQSMYQVAFDVPVFAQFVPWLMLNRNGLDVLVHPNTLQPRADHVVHALWLGRKLDIKPDFLEVRIDPSQESRVEVNTRPDLGL